MQIFIKDESNIENITHKESGALFNTGGTFQDQFIINKDELYCFVIKKGYKLRTMIIEPWANIVPGVMVVDSEDEKAMMYTLYNPSGAVPFHCRAHRVIDDDNTFKSLSADLSDLSRRFQIVKDVFANYIPAEGFRSWDSPTLNHKSLFDESLKRDIKLAKDDKSKNLIDEKPLSEEEEELIKQFADLDYGIITRSRSMVPVFEDVIKYAKSDHPILITGETGTGKELIAQAVNELSKRSKKSLIVVNCSAIPKELAESELFGHVKGAFTGANIDRIGHFEAAIDGIIFLDEIGDLAKDLQPKLLRVIEYGYFMRVGESVEVKTNARIIAATNKSLEKEVEKELFRDDLYHRLNQLPIELPSLNERAIDIPLLASKFFNIEMKKISSKSKYTVKEEQFKQLVTVSWNGNIRELKAFSQRLALDYSYPKNSKSLSELVQDELNNRISIEYQSESIDVQKVLSGQIEEVFKEYFKSNCKATRVGEFLKLDRGTVQKKMNSAYLLIYNRYKLNYENISKYLRAQHAILLGQEELFLKYYKESLINIIDKKNNEKGPVKYWDSEYHYIVESLPDKKDIV